MEKNFDNAIELFPVTEEELEKINKYSLTELTEKDIFAFNVILCDNEIDRDFECFDTPALNKLAELFVGKTGILNHDMKAENQVARIYSAEVIKDGDYACLKARAYMLRSDKNQPLIDEICAGIKKEVSINCAVSQIICSVCGKDVKKHICEHQCHHGEALLLCGLLHQLEEFVLPLQHQRRIHTGNLGHRQIVTGNVEFLVVGIEQVLRGAVLQGCGENLPSQLL